MIWFILISLLLKWLVFCWLFRCLWWKKWCLKRFIMLFERECGVVLKCYFIWFLWNWWLKFWVLFLWVLFCWVVCILCLIKRCICLEFVWLIIFCLLVWFWFFLDFWWGWVFWCVNFLKFLMGCRLCVLYLIGFMRCLIWSY